MRHFSALIAAFLITGLIGFAMFTVGTNAILNKDTVPMSNAPGSSSSVQTTDTPDPTQAQIQQLQNLISQYQAREKQYQQREQQYQSQLDQATQQLNQENSQLQAYQQLLFELQRRGVIVVGRDGSILIPRE